MAKADPKTTQSTADAGEFIQSIQDPARRAGAEALDAVHRKVTGLNPAMWGPSIIGYGSYHYKYESGREGTMCRAGFSPRKAALTVYLTGIYVNSRETAEDLLAQLGKQSTGKGCLYIKKIGDVDMAVLEQLVRLNWDYMNQTYPA